MRRSDPYFPGDNNVLVRCRHGAFVCNRHDAYIGTSLIKYGEFSEHEGLVLRRLCKPGSIVVEVGANIGAHSVPLARHVGIFGKLIALEPQPTVFKLLEKNLKLNNLSHVHAYPFAAGQAQGDLVMPAVDYSRPGNFGGVSFQADGIGETVECVRLDDLIDEDRVHLIKIDVEGSEQEVIEGGRSIIQAHRPILYVENDRQEKSAPLIECLFGLNYRLFWDLPPLFNEDNFNGDDENIFKNIVSVNMICVPIERCLGEVAKSAIVDPHHHPLHRAG